MKKKTLLMSGLTLLLATSGLLLSKQLRQQTDNSQLMISKTSEKQNKTAKLRPNLSKPVTLQPVTAAGKEAGQTILEQRPDKPIQTSKFDFASLQNGDFTSITGTWSDAKGWLFGFSPSGIVTPNRLHLSALYQQEAGQYQANVQLENGYGFVLYFYPAGTKIPSSHFRFTKEDPSDISRDRLIGSQTAIFDTTSTQDFIDSVYYKVSDSSVHSNQDFSTQTSTTEQLAGSEADPLSQTTEALVSQATTSENE